MYTAISRHSQVNITSRDPAFSLVGLTPGHDYSIMVVAMNHLGESSPVKLDAFTYKMAENRMSKCLIKVKIFIF